MQVYPLIHINDPSLAAEQAIEAVEMGATGVFLQSKRTQLDDGRLEHALNATAEHISAAKLGVTVLGLRPISAFGLVQDMLDDGRLGAAPGMLWAPDAMAEGKVGETEEYRCQYPELKGMTYLGGIAGKKLMGVEWSTAEDAARQSVEYKDLVDVVTTTGERDGKSQTPDKLLEMRSALYGHNKRLMVTSNVTLHNLDDFAGCVDGLILLSRLDAREAPGVVDREQLARFIERAGELHFAA